ncbi:IPT/TIG domain-containing protein [Chloroflexota bacterium]
MLGGEVRKSFTVRVPEIGLDLDEGAVATEVTVSGDGMYAGGIVDIYYYRAVGRVNVGEAVAGPAGGFTHTLSIPESIQGSHRIIAEDAQDNSAETSFEVIPTIKVSPSSGAIGDELSVSGDGFSGSSDVSVYFNNMKVAEDETSNHGSFELTITVPTVESGDYDIKAEDSGDNRAAVAFTITAGAAISPAEGSVGAPIIVSGVGFKAAAIVTITYADEEVATAVTGGNGAFSVTFIVPPSTGGPHPVTVTDGTNTLSSSFTVETEPPPAPELLAPSDDTRAAPAAEFDWEDVSDDSGVTYTLQVATKDSFAESQVVLEVVGLTDSEYAVAEGEELEPSSKESPHYWRVKTVDGAANESEWSAVGSFYVGSGFTLPVTVQRVLIGLAIAGAGFFGFWLGRRTAYAKRA